MTEKKIRNGALKAERERDLKGKKQRNLEERRARIERQYGTVLVLVVVDQSVEGGLS